jgi:septum formation protein
MKLVLASTSVWRGELLARLGLAFDQDDPELDETPWMERGLPARELTVALARAKAAAVAARRPGDLVLGADQVVSVAGRILGKPGSRERAIEQLELLSGRTHELVTGLALHDAGTGEVQTAVDVHEVTLRSLPRSSIVRYVDREEVTGCAGAYKVEGLGIALFRAVRGDDYTAVIGLPLTRVTELLAAAGMDPLH